MTPQLKQDTRIGDFTTPLGKDVLVLVRFDGSEGWASCSNIASRR